jgi:predicted outer membrane repeat protein
MKVLIISFFVLSLSSVMALAPMVLAHPESQMIQTGASATLSVVVDVSGPLSYQWKKDGVDIPSTNSATYVLSNAQTDQIGQYTVVVSNVDGSCTAGPAAIFVGARRTVFVRGSATGANNGTSWANAYSSLTTALTNSLDGDDIWVAAGTYKPSSTINRDATFSVAKFVRMFGGFNGTETSLEQRNWRVNTTNLSGDLSNNDTGLGGNQGENSKRIVTVSASSGAIIDGFWVVGGSNTTPGQQPDFGAGVGFLSGGYGSMSSSAVVRNCVFRWNSAVSYGGAIGLWGSVSTPLTIQGCVFTQNSAPSNGGGAIQTDNCPLVVRDCLFDGNSTAGSGGGAITANNTRDIIIINSVFRGNVGSGGTGAGGVRVWTSNAAKYRIFQSTFYNNTGPRGAVYFENTPETTSCLFSNSIITGSGSIPVTFPVSSYLLSDQTISGTGNILGAPGFVNAASPLGADGFFGTADDGMALQPGSLGINAGSDSLVPSALAMDVAGQSRVLQQVDLGAYEHPQLTNGDFELPSLSVPDNLNVTGSEVMGWTKSGAGSLALLKNVAANLVAPKSGAQQLLFNSGDASVGAIMATTIPTVVGKKYRVQFYVGRSGAGSGVMGITSRVRDSSNNLLFSNRYQSPATQSYGQVSELIFTAASNFSLLSFEDTSMSTAGVDVLLDAISVVQQSTPTVISPTATSTNATGTTLGGNVTNDGGDVISERGVVYSATSINSDPLISGTGVTKVTATGATGVFTAPVTGLTQGTAYSYKAYAINSQGTTYTSVATFTTLSTNADLSALILSSGTLSPVFASATTAYTAGVAGSSASITLTPTLSQANATIEVRVNNGSYAAVTSGSQSAALSLNVGTNTLDVRVTAQDGVSQKIYTVTVTRDNPLRNLAVVQRAGARLVDLTYDLDVPAPVKITVEISNDGGQTYFVPVYALSGDVGLNVSAGNGKTITWDAEADWAGNRSDQMRFRIVADDLSDGFSYIPEGPYTMGRINGDTDSDAPQTLVNISKFDIQTTEVTKEQWDQVRSWGLINGYTDLAVGGAKASNHPVHSIKWWDVVKWCNARSEKEGLTPCYIVSGSVMKTGADDPEVIWDASGYRLCTEAEWEKCARGGIKGKRFPWGTNTINHAYANYYANSSLYFYDASGYASSTFHLSYNDGTVPYTSPVASFPANAYGLWDVTGNLNEWCWDWYQSNYYSFSGMTNNPRGPNTGTHRVRRGGSWTNFADYSRLSQRFYYSPQSSFNSLGFRNIRKSVIDGSNSISTLSLNIDTRHTQNITFLPIPNKVTVDRINLEAIGGGSSNPVTFAVASGPGVITNNVLTFTASGSVTITASQAGNDNYLAAPDVSRTFTVAKATATVTLGSLAQAYNGTPRVLKATTEPAGLSVEFTYDGLSTPPTAAGTYEVVGTINDLIYQGSATGTLEIGKASQAITFAAIPDKLTTDSVNLTATGGGSSNPVTFAVTSGPGVITNNVLTFTTSGSVTITASQAGSDNYLAAEEGSRTFTVTKATASVTLGSLAQTYNTTPRSATATTDPAGLSVEFTYDGSFTAPTNAGTYAVVGTINDLVYQGSAAGTLEIGKAAQAITFAAIPDKLTTDSVNLSATGGASGNAVTFAVTSGPGVITNNVLTFTTSGSVTIAASQVGSANYLAAPDVSRTFNVTKATATVTLGSLAQTYNSTPRSATATTDPAGLSVEFTYDGSANSPTNAGTYAVVGSINDLIYQGSATGTLEIGKASQTITFGAITDKLTTDSVSLTATGGDSGNPVTFAVTSGPGVIINNVLTFTTSGTVTITASQAGNANYLAAPDVSRTFTVTKATATVMLGSLAQTYNTTPRSATATTDPTGLSVEFTYDGSANPPTNSGTYAVVGTINDLIYQGSATGTLEIGKDSQTISFGAITDKLTTDSVNLTATGGGSANPVTFAVTSGPAVITNNVLTFTTSGTVTITASQAGNANYMAAEDVSRTFNVTKAEAPITFAQLSQVANGTPRPVSVSTTPSDLTVTTLYAGSPTAPTLPGSYAVSSTIEDPIYQGTASASLTVLGLTGLEQPILSGSTTPVVINGTDYGNVTLGRVLTRVFTLSNPGSQPVTLSGNPLVEVEGDHAGDFQVSVLPEAVIPAGGSVSFELRFAPTQPGARAARVKLACAALANGPITFAVLGFGALPAPRTQTLTFAPPATLYLSQSPLQLTAMASSGLPVSLQVISGPATLDQDCLLTFSSAGIVKVEARQAGNGSFAAAPSVQRTITVKPDPTGLTLVDLIKTYNGQPQEAGVVGAGDADVLVTYKVGTTYSEAPPANAGQYQVKAVAGSVTKTGTLVINPAPLVVNVEDKRRLVGEDNPAITVIFEGFIGADTLASVLEKPITTGTTATKTSPVGSYPITSSGGGVKPNYRLVHRPGTLVVEGVAGSYEALLRHPTSGLPNGHLALSVPGASRTFTASLRLSQETAPISWNGILALSAQSRLATAKVSKSVSGFTYELKVELSMFGELSCEVRRAGELIAASEDGIRLLTLTAGQKAAQEGNYTAILEPAKPAAASVPAGAGWATGKVDAKGLLTLTGRLGDGTSFTAGMAADVAEKPGYRLFIQPYLPARRGSHLGGSFTLLPHPRLAGRSYLAGSDIVWVKAGQLKDLGYRTDFGPVTTILRLDPWQAPTTTTRLATRLELASDGRWEVEQSDTGSLSQGALPKLVGVNASNVVSVVTPEANTRRWKMTITPATGAYTGSFELLDLMEVRKVNFSGVLRQTPTLADDLIGAGHYVLPALKADQNQEQKTGAVLFWRSE